MCAFSVVLITPAHSPEQPTVVYSLPLQGGCGGPASITSTTPQPSARSSTSQPPVALVAHGHLRTSRAPPAGDAAPAIDGPGGGAPRWPSTVRADRPGEYLLRCPTAPSRRAPRRTRWPGSASAPCGH